MKLAFLILAHTDPEHLNKIINALDYNSDFYIHLDKKSDIKQFEHLFVKKNIFFIKERVSVSWAGISMVDAMMNLLKEVLKNGDQYSHAIFTTGSCYPIKSIKKIHENFMDNPDKEFINFIDMRESQEHYIKLVQNKWFKEPFIDNENKFLKILDKGTRFFLNKLKLKNNWNNEFVPYYGHTWVGLTMNCCKYVCKFHTKNPWFREMNRLTFAPDEHYIHTIVGNSSFFNSCLPGKSEYKGRGLYQYTSLYLIHHSLNKWYDENDWEDIIASDKLFVRKINSQTGKHLVLKINREILKS